MAQFILGTTSDHTSISQRGRPNLHLDFAQRWTQVVDRYGYHYLGDTQTKKSLRVPRSRTERVLAIDSDGQAKVWRNRCLHNGRVLVQPHSDGLPKEEDRPIMCDWHNATYDEEGKLLRPGAMKIPVDSLSERRCQNYETLIWQDRIVFEIGSKNVFARRELEKTLHFIDKVAGDLFDFRHYQLRHSTVSPQDADLLMTIVNFLDIRHVANHRKTLAPLVNLRSYSHALDPENFAVFQRMGANPEWASGYSELAFRFRECGLAKVTPNYGAAWVTTSTGFMLEWYPGVIVLSVGLPDPANPWKCVLHHDFYYHEKADDVFVEEHQKLFYDTGIEDEVWCHDGSTFCQEEIAAGRGNDPWGFLDPAEENYGDWFYRMVRSHLQDLAP